MFSSSPEMQKRLAIRYSLKDKHSEIYKLSEALKVREQHIPNYNNYYQQHLEHQSSLGMDSTAKRFMHEKTPVIQMTVTMDSPVFKGS